MPWKGERDAYRIWLSEIILQQTRVEQGLAYYQRFIEKFPDIRQLAAAPDDEVYKLWEGLGYYSRCRNLLHTARHISHQLEGAFPRDYEGIKALKGIGPYTAAAISSFAFDLPHAVVDGNVFRVLSRIFGIAKPIDSTEGKKFFANLAQELLDHQRPALYNQAIMDFGATICKPANPLCITCIFNKECVAFREHRIEELPIKEKKMKIRKRWFYYLLLELEGTIAISRRSAKDIWQQLYEFPLLETDTEQDNQVIIDQARAKGWLKDKGYELLSVSPFYKQQLSHQTIIARFIRIKIKKSMPEKGDLDWVSNNALKNYAFPAIINQYFSSTERQALL